MLRAGSRTSQQLQRGDARRRHRGVLDEIARHRTAYLLVLPAVAYTFVFGYLTMPYVLIAFQRFNYRTGIFNSEWIGLRNFAFFFDSPRALQVTMNTLRLNFLSIILGVAAAVLIAVLLNELRSKPLLKVNQSAVLFPHFLSWMVVSYIIYAVFSTDYGLANRLLARLGLKSVGWYSSPGPWIWILPLIRIWKSVGMQSVIFLAAITGIDSQIYEAATIDGASRSQQILRITVPLLMPTVAILTLLSIGRLFYGDFAMVYSIIRDNGVLYPTADVIDTWVFRALRKTGNPSQAMAVGLYQAIMGFVMVFGSNYLTRRYFKEGALF